MLFSLIIAWIGNKVITYYLKTSFFPISANLVVFCRCITRLKGVSWGRVCTQNRMKNRTCKRGFILTHSTHFVPAFERIARKLTCIHTAASVSFSWRSKAWVPTLYGVILDLSLLLNGRFPLAWLYYFLS